MPFSMVKNHPQGTWVVKNHPQGNGQKSPPRDMAKNHLHIIYQWPDLGGVVGLSEHPLAA